MNCRAIFSFTCRLLHVITPISHTEAQRKGLEDKSGHIEVYARAFMSGFRTAQPVSGSVIPGGCIVLSPESVIIRKMIKHTL